MSSSQDWAPHGWDPLRNHRWTSRRISTLNQDGNPWSQRHASKLFLHFQSHLRVVFHEFRGELTALRENPHIGWGFTVKSKKNFVKIGRWKALSLGHNPAIRKSNFQISPVIIVPLGRLSSGKSLYRKCVLWYFLSCRSHYLLSGELAALAFQVLDREFKSVCHVFSIQKSFPLWHPPPQTHSFLSELAQYKFFWYAALARKALGALLLRTLTLSFQTIFGLGPQRLDFLVWQGIFGTSRNRSRRAP